ncbi:MAG: zf-HC2 domain-containing protein [Actinomycetota bacterium]
MTAHPDCADVRQDLPEHALGVLSEARRSVVSEHLAWCAGCRKESAGLAEGAAVVGLTSREEPDPGLEERVVGAVLRRAGRGRRAGPRIAVVLAAAVAMGSVALAGALAGRVSRLEDAAALARGRADAAARGFEEVLKDVGGSVPVLSAPLLAEAGDGGGRALLFDAPEGRDFVLVVVGGLSPAGDPYLAYLVSPSGRRLEVGRLRGSGPDQLSRYRFIADLAGARDLVVVDRTGTTVVRATFPPA